MGAHPFKYDSLATTLLACDADGYPGRLRRALDNVCEPVEKPVGVLCVSAANDFKQMFVDRADGVVGHVEWLHFLNIGAING